MSLNGKSKTLTSNQDYMNLLYSDSDSDDRVPDLKLPPLKGKKHKRRRAHGGRPEDAQCSVGTVLKYSLLCITFISVISLCGVSFWSVQKIKELQEKVEVCEF